MVAGRVVHLAAAVKWTKEMQSSYGNAIEIFHFEEENFIKIINFLKKSDQVKYARHAPIPEKMIQDKKEIEEIIQII